MYTCGHPAAEIPGPENNPDSSCTEDTELCAVAGGGPRGPESNNATLDLQPADSDRRPPDPFPYGTPVYATDVYTPEQVTEAWAEQTEEMHQEPAYVEMVAELQARNVDGQAATAVTSVDSQEEETYSSQDG